MSDRVVQSPDTMVEQHIAVVANGFLEVHNVRVRRGDDNHIYYSVDNQSANEFLGGGITRVAPRIVFDGVGVGVGVGVTVFHTGQDGHVYFSRNTRLHNLDNEFNWSHWSPIDIGSLRTYDPISVVQLTGHPGQLYLAWRGESDNHI